MLKRFTILLAFFAFFVTSIEAQCDTTTQSVLRLELKPDQYWYEVSWVITATGTGTILGQGECANTNMITQTYCVPNNTCVEFRINDEYGDGMAPNGYYKLYLNDSLIYENPNGNYNYFETFSFNCPPGSNCDAATELGLGEHFTSADGSQTWYSFTPEQNGTYHVGTCFPENTCPTKIWVYTGDCSTIVPSDNVTGTIFYNQGGCPDSIMAQATLYLEGEKEYYIRLGYADASCDTAAIKFELTYIGEITGCTDPTACNYDPLATISGDCIYPGNPDCPNAPDLIVLEGPLLNTIKLGFRNNNDACDVAQGCMRGFGQRTLLEFTTHIKNIGEEDYYIGHVPSSPSDTSTQFVWDPCHNHWHYLGYAEYILFDENNNFLPIGSKTGFCVLDLECNDGGDGQYNCSNMGISAHCGDIYDIGLPCQWIDITDLASGFYTFVMRVNWDKSPDKIGRVEKTYDNNWVQACFTLNYSATGAPIVDFVDDCPVYTDCMGEVHGTAKLDCEGVCNGTSLHGDWNLNLTREETDIDGYLDAALTDNDPASACRDLYADNHLDVYDAALLQECVIHGDDPAYWVNRFPCQFPAGTDNPQDIVRFSLNAVDTIAKTVDIRVINPFNKILGYEFELSGIVIDSVVNLMPDYNATYLHTDNRIVSLSTSEQAMPKNAQPTSFLRVYYTNTTGISVCLDSIIAVVNDKYQKSNTQINAPECLYLVTVGAQEPQSANAFPMQLLPNPANSDVSLFFPNPKALSSAIEVFDAQGRKILSYNSIRDGEVILPRYQFPGGVYMVRVSNESGVSTARLIWQ